MATTTSCISAGTGGVTDSSSEPYKYLPFQRNRKFIGRLAETDRLERKLFVERDCQNMAVVGAGGIGKMQVALHFAYLVLGRHADVSVFSIPALSLEAFEQAYREIARVLRMVVSIVAYCTDASLHLVSYVVVLPDT